MSGEPIPMKIIMFGDPGTGKTSLVETYREGKFKAPKPTIGSDVVIKSILLKNVGQKEVAVNIHVWDTSGQEKYRHYISPMYYRGAHGCVIVLDVTQPVDESKAQVQRWVEELNSKAPNCPYVVVGNKIDLLPEGCTHSLRQWGHWSERKRNCIEVMSYVLNVIPCEEGSGCGSFVPWDCLEEVEAYIPVDINPDFYTSAKKNVCVPDVYHCIAEKAYLNIIGGEVTPPPPSAMTQTPVSSIPKWFGGILSSVAQRLRRALAV